MLSVGAFAWEGGERMASKFDWLAIEREYVEGVAAPGGNIVYPTTRDLAEKYGCSVALIGRHSKKGQWAVKREQKKLETLSSEATRYDLECFNISREAVARVREMLASAATSKEVATLARAMKDMQAVAKVALGDTSSAQDGVLHIEVRMDED